MTDNNTSYTVCYSLDQLLKTKQKVTDLCVFLNKIQIIKINDSPFKTFKNLYNISSRPFALYAIRMPELIPLRRFVLEWN